MPPHLSKACWEIWLSNDQPHSDCNGQWQKAFYMVAVLESSQPNPHRNKIMENVCYKQIKICAECRDMLPRPRLDLSGTLAPRPIGLKLRFLTKQHQPGQHVPVFWTDLNLYNSVHVCIWMNQTYSPVGLTDRYMWNFLPYTESTGNSHNHGYCVPISKALAWKWMAFYPPHLPGTLNA